MTSEYDWAQELIADMERESACDYDAGKEFRQCYAGGDTSEACEAFGDAALCEVDASNPGYGGTYTCYVFADGSCYCDWKEGLDRFFAEADMLADEERGSDPKLAEKIDAAYAAAWAQRSASA